MKKLLIAFCVSVAFIACDNAADSEARKKDSIDSIANAKKDKIDSSAEQRKEVIDSVTEKQKEAVDKLDSLNKRKDLASN